MTWAGVRSRRSAMATIVGSLGPDSPRERVEALEHDSLFLAVLEESAPIVIRAELHLVDSGNGRGRADELREPVPAEVAYADRPGLSTDLQQLELPPDTRVCERHGPMDQIDRHSRSPSVEGSCRARGPGSAAPALASS